MVLGPGGAAGLEASPAAYDTVTRGTNRSLDVRLEASQGSDMQLEFSGDVFQWRGPSPYYYVRVPGPESDELREWSHVSYGWGVIPVTGRVGGTTFTTSLFPKDGGYLLPLKDAVRRKADITAGDAIAVAMTVVPARR